MKKILILLIVTLITNVVQAQTMEEAKRHIYFERFETAKHVLYSVIAKGNASPDAWYWLGEIDLGQKKIDSARKILLEGEAYLLRNNFSKKAFPLLSIGWAYLLLAAGNSTEARKFQPQLNYGLVQVLTKDLE